LNKNLVTKLEKIRFSPKSIKRELFTVSLFLCLLAATAGMVQLSSAQTDQISPDWTSVTHNFFNLSPATTEPVLTASMVTDRTGVTFLADPFLFHEGGTWYMFFEVNQHGNVADSDIGLAISSDGIHWTYQHIVLDETFHIAHPQVFKWDGTYYMIPDTYDQNAIKLYQAANFPDTWAFVANIAIGPGFTDSSIFRYNDMWWLFTSDGGNNMYLYYSDNLVNPSSWHLHPIHPIISNDLSKARTVGSVVFDGSTLIRLAQKDDVVYGQSVRAFQVDTITTTSYAEHEISQSPLVQASGNGWNKDGMHSLDPWWTGTRWLAVVDGVNYSPSEVWSIGIYESPIVEYQLTTSTNYGAVLPANGSHDIGSTVILAAAPPTAPPGEQYVFVGWTGTGTGSYSGPNNPASVTMNGDITEAAQWKIQYYLNVSSVNGDTGGSGWYDNGATANAALTALTVAGATGTQYLFTGWSGDALGATSPSDNITMNGPKTATANWQTQYNVTFSQSGVGSDFFGTVLTVNDTNYGFSGYTTWANASDTYTFSYSPQLIITSNAKQCLLTGLSGNSTTSTLTASTTATVTGTYKTQYYLTTTSNYGSPLPANGWYDSGSSISAFIASPVSGNSGTQYVCTGWSGTGSVPPSGSVSAISFAIGAPSSLAWNWKTQYLVSFAANPSGDGTTSPAGTNIWQDAGSISISGTPSYNYRFSSWSADTASITFGNSNTASTTAIISGPGNITANFVTSPAATPTPTPVRTPTPTNSPTSSPQPTPSRTPEPTNSSPTPTPSQSTNNLATNPYFYVLIVAIVIAVTAAILFIRKRK
jgi:uncharacterized repeat protein (TIGR02543 family)